MKSIEFFHCARALILPIGIVMTGLGCNFIIGAGEPESNGPNVGAAASDNDGEGGQEPISACGNGLIDEGEACDDGNTIEGDGCYDCALDCGNAMLGEFKDLTTKHCFRLITAPTATWVDAELECENWAGTLAAPTSLAEFVLLQNRIKTDTWIGGRKEHLDGAYQWITGENFWTPDMTFPSENATAELPCVMIDGEYLNFVGTECGETHAFMCEKNE